MLCINGNTHLGGDDFDEELINFLAEEFRKQEGIDLRKDPMALQRLKEACEKAKIELSNAMETTINLPFITADQNGPKHLQIDDHAHEVRAAHHAAGRENAASRCSMR